MNHTMPFVYHLLSGCNQSDCSHPGLLKNSPLSPCGSWREGCGGDEGKGWVFSADRSPAQCAERTAYVSCLHTLYFDKARARKEKKKNSLKVTLKWTFFNNIEHFLRHFTNICLWPTHLWQLFASIFYFHQFQAGGNKLLDTISVMTLSEGQVIEEYSHFFWTICTNYFEYV